MNLKYALRPFQIETKCICLLPKIAGYLHPESVQRNDQAHHQPKSYLSRADSSPISRTLFFLKTLQL